MRSMPEPQKSEPQEKDEHSLVTQADQDDTVSQGVDMPAQEKHGDTRG
jgi:hypothetical protein